MYGETWCQDGPRYCAQFTNVKGVRAYNKLIKTMSSWKLSAEGTCGKNKKVLIFVRDFSSRDEWIAWGKTITDYKLNAVNAKGKILKYPKMGKQPKK
jgi:hypothetical protein